MLIPGGQEWVVILLVIALLFGASKLPELARQLGRSRVEFEKGKKEAELELLELERKYRESSSRAKLEEVARSLDIDPTGLSDEELRRAIEAEIALRK